MGAGDICRRVHLPVLKNIQNVSVAWIADVNFKQAEIVGSLFGVLPLQIEQENLSFPECEVVLLATPVHSRSAYLKYFAERGVAVFAEKPFSLTSEEHLSYVALFDKSSIDCAYMRRTYANLRMLRQFVKSKWLGELRSIAYQEGGRVTSTEFGSATLDLSYLKGGGVLRDLGCHGLDAIFFITGSTQYRIDSCVIEWDELTDRHVEANLCISQEASVSAREITVNFAVSWLKNQSNHFVLEFENAYLRSGIKPDSEIQVASSSSFHDAMTLTSDMVGARTPLQAYYLEWEAVLSALRTEGDSGFSASEAICTTRLVEDLYKRGLNK